MMVLEQENYRRFAHLCHTLQRLCVRLSLLFRSIYFVIHVATILLTRLRHSHFSLSLMVSDVKSGTIPSNTPVFSIVSVLTPEMQQIRVSNCRTFFRRRSFVGNSFRPKIQRGIILK